MKKHIKQLLTFGSILIILVFTIFVVNQLIALYANLYTVNPILANVIVGLVGGILIVTAIVPFVLLMRLPKPLPLPESESDLDDYKQKLIDRLSKNRLLKGNQFDFNNENDIKEALRLLDEKANEIINETGSSVFLTTAISQNGKLDAFTVLITQTRMVWKIAHIYWQRPALRDVLHLYSNVLGTAFLASEIEEMDLSRQIEPVINAMLKSPGRSLPIVGHAAHIITDSLLEGSTNAFLTLRVGVIAKRYCAALDVVDKKAIRKNAFIEASVMLKSLVLNSSSKVVKSLVQATKDTGVNTIKSGVGAVSKVANNMKDGITGLAGKLKKDNKEVSALEPEKHQDNQE